MSLQSWPRQKALPHITELGVQRLSHRIVWHRVGHDRGGQARTVEAHAL